MRKEQIYLVLAVLLFLVLIVIFLVCIFLSCKQTCITSDDPFPQTKESEAAFFSDESSCSEATEKELPWPLEIEVHENREEELVFSIAIEDYIDSYNSYWQYDFGGVFFTPHQQWRKFCCTPSIHSFHETNGFCFTQDERVYSLPTITVYVPTNANYIQEVTINFDDHSYTESGFSQFRKMCVYSLKVFFPDIADARLQDLCDEIISLGNMNLFGSDQWYGPDPTPCALFYRKGIGIYPYFAAGDWEYFCIIPVTSDTIRKMESKGVKIYEIE